MPPATPAAALIDRFRENRTLPHNVARLTQLVNDQESTLQDFEAVIRLDPALVARLLTVVNSAWCGLKRRVDSISRAVALLGTRNLRNIAITDAVQGMLCHRTGSTGFSPVRLWLHSAASGICGKMIAERIFAINGDDAYLCGILHDIGLIVELETSEPLFFDLMERLVDGGPTIVDLEREVFATDHGEIGALLAREWRIAEPVAAAIADHHRTDLAVAPQSAAGILQISEYLVHQLGYGVKDGLSASLAPELAAHIQASVEEYRAVAEDLPAEMERTRQVYGA